jgi:hypothetical protein
MLLEKGPSTVIKRGRADITRVHILYIKSSFRHFFRIVLVALKFPNIEDLICPRTSIEYQSPSLEYELVSTPTMIVSKLLYTSVGLSITISLVTYQLIDHNRNRQLFSNSIASLHTKSNVTHSTITGGRNIWADLNGEEILSLEKFLYSSSGSLNLSLKNDDSVGEGYSSDRNSQAK